MGRIKKQFGLTLSPRTYELLNKACEKQGVTRSDFIESVLLVVLDPDLKKNLQTMKNKVLLGIVNMSSLQIAEFMKIVKNFGVDMKTALLEAQT